MVPAEKLHDAHGGTVAPNTQLTVLVLDDSAAQRNMVSALLRRWGHDARPAANPEEALDLARDPAIDLILCDWMMPGMDGPEFCRRFRADNPDSSAYVLLLTSKTDANAVEEGLEAGADDFLNKPVRPPELRARMNAGARIVATQRALRENNRLLENTLDELQSVYGAIERDLDEARRHQQALLQDRHYQFNNATVSLFLQSSGPVGGDMVGCFEVNENMIGFYSLDVSGHGVASAMIGSRVAGMLSGASPDQNISISRCEDGRFTDLPPKMAAARLNAMFLKELQTDRYFTMALGFLNTSTGLMRVVQAGHPNPLILHADGRVEEMGDGGMPVGLLPDASFSEWRTRLQPGDRVLFYSDGLTECPGPNGGDEMLEEEGLVQLVSALGQERGEAFLNQMHKSLQDYAGTSDFPDAVSALLLEY